MEFEHSNSGIFSSSKLNVSHLSKFDNSEAFGSSQYKKPGLADKIFENLNKSGIYGSKQESFNKPDFTKFEQSESQPSNGLPNWSTPST